MAIYVAELLVLNKSLVTRRILLRVIATNYHQNLMIFFVAHVPPFHRIFFFCIILPANNQKMYTKENWMNLLGPGNKTSA